LAWRRTTTSFVYVCYTSLAGDGHHQKYECDTNFFVCLLVRCYRIDALPLPLVRFAPNCGFKNRFLPCVTNPLVNTRPGRRVAQAALNLCDSLEQRRDLGICLSFISLNAELVASRTSTPLGSRSHENRRRLDGDLLRSVEWRAGVHLRLSRRLSPRQEEAIMAKNLHPRQRTESTRTSALNATVASCSRTSTRH